MIMLIWWSMILKNSMWNDHRQTPQQKQTISLNMDTKSTNWKCNIQTLQMWKHYIYASLIG